jgi:hypothetical protein
MTKENLRGTLILGIFIVVVGFIMLFFSVRFGTSLAENWLIKQGGANTDTYNIIVKSYINNFLVTGSILSSFGLLLNSFAYYKLRTIKEKSFDI